MISRRPSSLRTLCSVLLPHVCHDFEICEGLHEAQHAVASGHHISAGRHAAPLCAEGAARAGVEILSKLAGIFKPFQITLGICCGKQSRVLFLMLGLLMNLCMREFNCIAAGSTAQSLRHGRALALPNVKDGTWAFKAAAFLSLMLACLGWFHLPCFS